jgi:hypothetical protein
LENRVEGYSTGGGAEIPERTRDDGKFVLRQPALLGKERYKTRIGLMGGETLQGGPGNATSEFNVLDHFFQPRDGRAGESFSIEMHVEVPVRSIGDANRSSVLPRASKEKLPEGISSLRRGAFFCAQEKRASAIAEQATEFSGHQARSESAAMNVGSDDGNGAGLTRGDEALSYSECVHEAEARAANIQRTAVFASKELGVKLCSQRRKTPVRFAGGDNPIQLLGAASRILKGLPRRARAKCDFIFVVSGIRKRFYSSAMAKFSGRHAESPIDFLGENSARADCHSRSH